MAGITDDDEKMGIFTMGLPAAEFSQLVMNCSLPTDYADTKAHLLKLYEPLPEEASLRSSFQDAFQPVSWRLLVSLRNP